MANISFVHARDHAAVLFAGELDWEAAHTLVSTLETVIDRYFYRRVELVIASPGGLTQALEYYLGAVHHWQRQQVHFRTRVISSASSAAAVMVSLGDDRVAEPGAKLLYHHARAFPGAEVTASETAELQAALHAADQRLIGHLCDRVLAGTRGVHDVPCESERSDRGVLERLYATLRDGRETKPRKRRRLARAIGHALQRAANDADRETLARIYRRLFEVETPISAPLARTLRLIDRIGSRTGGAYASHGMPGLSVPEWHALYPPDGEVPREALTRHTLVLGETGSGKTASCMLPIVAALAKAPTTIFGAALVIDPKLELGPVLETLAPQRVHHVTAEAAVLDLMAGPRWSLDEDIACGRTFSAALRILSRVASFVRSNPAHVLMDHEPGSANAEFFNREGTALAATVLAFILLVTRAPALEEWIGDDVEAFAWMQELLERARGTETQPGPNALALAGWALDGPLVSSPAVQRSLGASDSNQPPNDRWLFARLARALLAHLGEKPGEFRDLLRRIVEYWSPMACSGTQYAGVLASASTVCADFAAPAIARTLYFGCEPGFRDAKCSLDFAHLVCSDGPATVVLFQPARDGLDNLVAVALKATFFEAVLDDPDRAARGADLPLVGYVADECHRFVTSDPVHGEQSYLDTCRSFGAFCVLASQCVASLEHALAKGGGSARQDQSAVELLWINTASKIVFRSTDAKTSRRVEELCPDLPGLAGVVRVRPLSTLSTGECYAALPDGRFERRQLLPYRAALPEPAPSVARLDGPGRDPSQRCGSNTSEATPKPPVATRTGRAALHVFEPQAMKALLLRDGAGPGAPAHPSDLFLDLLSGSAR